MTRQPTRSIRHLTAGASFERAAGRGGSQAFAQRTHLSHGRSAKRSAESSNMFEPKTSLVDKE